MKAAVLNRCSGTFDIEEIAIDAPRGHEVLVDVKASGLCHTDLHLANHDFGFPLPSVLGHEVAGIVREIGPDVVEFAPGDHVAGSLVQWCGHCAPCREGRSILCDRPEHTLRAGREEPRLSRDGKPVHQGFGMAGFAERALIHEHQLAKIPEELPFPQAAILGCGCVTGAGAVLNTAGVKPGETVAVVGIGGIGLNIVTGAKLAGARRIVAIDVHPAKEALARRFGATDFVDAAAGNPVEAVVALCGGVDHAFEAVGQPRTVLQAIRMTRRGGAAYLIGINKPGDLLELDSLQELIASQRSVRGVMMGSTNLKRDIPLYADLYLQGRFNLDDLVSREINLAEINAAYAEIGAGGVARSVITSF